MNSSNITQRTTVSLQVLFSALAIVLVMVGGFVGMYRMLLDVQSKLSVHIDQHARDAALEERHGWTWIDDKDQHERDCMPLQRAMAAAGIAFTCAEHRKANGG